MILTNARNDENGKRRRQVSLIVYDQQTDVPANLLLCYYIVASEDYVIHVCEH